MNTNEIFNIDSTMYDLRMRLRNVTKDTLNNNLGIEYLESYTNTYYKCIKSWMHDNIKDIELITDIVHEDV